MSLVKKLTKKNFEKWLKRQHSNRRMKTGCTDNCPIAEFAMDISKRKYAVVDGSIIVSNLPIEFDGVTGNRYFTTGPLYWVDRFITEIDNFGAGKRTNIVSPKECLTILNERE